MKHKFLLPFVSIAIMIASVSCTYALATRVPSSQQNSSTASTPTPVPVDKELSPFNQIEGTHYLMAEISASSEVQSSSGSPFILFESGYSRTGYETYNFVFFDLDTESYHRLLPTNESVILQTTGFPTPVADSSQPDAPKRPVEWWLYVVAKADTDGNGVMNYSDKLTLGVSDVGGNQFTEIVGDVDHLLGSIYKDSALLFVMYHSNGKNYLAKINLLTREVVTTTEMDLGEDVK